MDKMFRSVGMGSRTSPSSKILINILFLLIYGTLSPIPGVAAQESQQPHSESTMTDRIAPLLDEEGPGGG